jgi:hypothetical protein
MKLWRWLLPALSLAAVVVFTWWDVSRVQAGPGPLHPVHAMASGLDGGANCAGCHERGAVAASGCIACHQPIGNQLSTHRGVHGSLPAAAARACGTCHSDHHGDQRPLLPTVAFVRAGIEHVEAYRHEHVAFGLEGVHETLACEACHPHARDEHPPAGGRFLGKSQRCASCHKDPHRGAFGGDCAVCHGQQPGWRPAARLRHERFALEHGHAAVACTDCHDASGERSVSQELLSQLPVRVCADCHANPHGTTEVAVADPSDCARCHSSASFGGVLGAPDAHAALGHELHGVHRDVSCRSCHGEPGGRPSWGAGSAPTPADCARCHEAPHDAALLRAADAVEGANGCADCHLDSDAGFESGRITPSQHAATGFALAAPHDEVACSTCHVGATRSLRFPDRQPGDCRVCHPGPHGAQFVDGGSMRACTVCHAHDRWQPHHFDANAHAATFPLTGAHDAVACTLCHQRDDAGVRRFVGTPDACAHCHEDVHTGRFDAEGLPREVDGRDGCARCHDTRGFRQLRTRFEHGPWTGHRLEGAHAEVACSACHARRPAGGLGAAPGKRCSDCHDDVHRGQFAVGKEARRATDCRRCHQPTSWPEIRFDHGRDSRFRLDATHRQLACSRCHVPRQQRDGSTFVRYRPLGRDCADCHHLGGKESGR